MKQAILDQKKSIVSEFEQRLNEAKSVLVFEYLGLNAKELTKLRRKLHEENATVYILKNNITNRAFKASRLNAFPEVTGPNAIIIANGNEVISFKLINEIIKTRAFVKFKGGVIEDQMIVESQLSSIASIPGREGLYSMFLSCLQAPIRNFLYGLKAISETKN